MRRILSTLLVAMTFVGILFAQGVTMRRGVVHELESGDTISASQSRSTQVKPAGKKRKVDYMADLVKPYNQGSHMASLVFFVSPQVEKVHF